MVQKPTSLKKRVQKEEEKKEVNLKVMMSKIRTEFDSAFKKADEVQPQVAKPEVKVIQPKKPQTEVKVIPPKSILAKPKDNKA